ncbi:uncharacterized protein KRP23_10955 [Phytophthora ramorum]|uniref:uncharacterized protein n=1 Tax=Phytophthora ramorum TaxID=164328 RepID=UPI0030B5F86D|nr:hypothetical protein KRP23_10955 [Phytophthora ramorum]
MLEAQEQDVPPRRLEGDVPPRMLEGQQQDVPPRMLEGDVPPRKRVADVPPRMLSGQDVQQQATHQSIIAEDGLEETDSDNWDAARGGEEPQKKNSCSAS